MPHAALLVVQEVLVHWQQNIIRCFNAARGFVGGARERVHGMVQRTDRFNAARGFVGGARRDVTLLMLPVYCFNAARGFVGGASTNFRRKIQRINVSMPHAALLVVQVHERSGRWCDFRFQCRTRLCWWCKCISSHRTICLRYSFNAARGFVGGASGILPL